MQPNNSYYGSSGPELYPSQKKRVSKRMLLLIIGIIVIVIVVVLAALTTISKPSLDAGKSEQVIELIQLGKGDESYALFSPKAQTSTTADDWVYSVVQMKRVTENKKVEKVYSQKLDDNTTETGYNIGEKGDIYRFRVITNQDGLVEAISYNKTLL